MAINIPDSLFTSYEEGADAMIDNFGVNCKVVYPAKRTDCTNCVTNTIGGKSMNFYRHGGPLPFSRGMLCPMCNGRGFKSTENSEYIKLRVYWRRKDWINVDFQVDVQDNFIQTIGYITDLPKLNRAKEIIVHKEIEGYETLRFRRASEGYPHGLRQNRYIAMFWRRA